MKLIVKNLDCGYGQKKIIKDISLTVKEGETVCLLGPNGVGKTTFFKTILGFLKPLAGTVELDGIDIHKLSRKEFAQLIAYVPQAHSVPFPFKTKDVVLMGRNAHTGIMSVPSQKDRRYALESMETLGIGHLKEKVYTELSGGEQQMVLIARALTQQTRLLIMDEPTSNLDFGNQVKILNQINRLQNKGIAVVLTTHSPDQVFLCGTKVIIFHNGRLTETGYPRHIVTENILEKVYGVSVKVRDIPVSDSGCVTVCIPCLEGKEEEESVEYSQFLPELKEVEIS